MPIFAISDNKLIPVEQSTFSREKALQSLIEDNLAAVFNCRFVATEFSTGEQHAGRVDSLALSEEDHPVIIEYKKIGSSALITQSLSYLHWLQDHQGDFEIAAQKTLGNGVKIDWADVRVICIAPNYTKYDLHAVQIRGVNIELWKYRLFKNNFLSLEKVLHDTKTTAVISQQSDKDPVRAAAIYTFDEHFAGKPNAIQTLMHKIREFILGLDSAIEEIPKKYYIAYRSSKNIACMSARRKHIKMFVTLKPAAVLDPPKTYRDVSNIGHLGTGDTEFTVSTSEQFEEFKQYIALAYNKIGG